MSDTKSGAATAADKANQIWGDLVPVLGFVFSYNGLRLFAGETGLFSKETALYWATGVLMAATAWIVVDKLRKGLRVPPFMIVTSAIVGGFGALGILLQDKSFLYIKPSIQNLFLAGIVFGGFALGRNVWRDMFKSVFDLPDFAWNTLAVRWGILFVAMAFWNEYLWRTYAPLPDAPLIFAGLTLAPSEPYSVFGLNFGLKDAEAVWANWKFGNMLIVFLFGLANTPYTLKHLRAEPQAPAAAE
ncbi:MAG: septation protein IspZ [Pseudomonadota bacterium]